MYIIVERTQEGRRIARQKPGYRDGTLSATTSSVTGKVSGEIRPSGPITATYNGTETAPKHIYVRYLIPAKN